MTAPSGRTRRWVLDTNIVLSALVRPGGTLGRLRLAWQAGLFVPLASRSTASELIRVLAYPKFRLTPDEQHHLLADYLPWTRVVRIPDPPPITPRCRDPGDVPFLQLAIAGKAAAIVTGDADLLSLRASIAPRVSIFTASEAIDVLTRADFHG